MRSLKYTPILVATIYMACNSASADTWKCIDSMGGAPQYTDSPSTSETVSCTKVEGTGFTKTERPDVKQPKGSTRPAPKAQKKDKHSKPKQKASPAKTPKPKPRKTESSSKKSGKKSKKKKSN